MKLLTAQGSYTDTAKASGWPLAGLDQPRALSTSWNSIRLVDLPGGLAQFAAYCAIYRQSPWVFACVQKLARGLARLPLKTYELAPDGQRVRVRGDVNAAGRLSAGQQLDRLLHRPNTDLSGEAMRYASAVDELVHGNALWTIERDAASRIVGLWHVPWRRVTVHTGRSVPVLKYTVAAQGGLGQDRDYAPEDCIHFGRGSDPESPVGLSPLEPLARDLGILDAVARQLTAFFANAARPSGNLKLEGANADTLAVVREQVAALYGAPENAGTVMVTSGDFQPISVSPEHSRVIEVAKISREAACAVYDVPPPVIGILEFGVKSNAREMREQFYRDALGPRASMHEADLASQLLPRQASWARHFTEFDLAEVLRPDPESQARVLGLSDYLTVDEKRKVMNLPPLNIDGVSDRPLVAPGVVPLGQQWGAEIDDGDDQDEDAAAAV